MTYNKKQMQPLIDKFQINPETNRLFCNIIEMFDNQPNYQIWAVKGVFGKTFEYETLAKIHDWAVLNQNLIKSLEKKNIVSYSTKAAISQLLHEMTALDNVAIIKDIISHFNTEQKKMLTEAILPRELNGLEAYNNSLVKTWGGIFTKFDRLPSSRKNNFYTKASGIRDVAELQGLIKDALEATYRWDKEDLLAYLENNTKDVEVVFNQGPYVIIRVPNFEMSKKLCGGGRTQWCLTMERDHWNNYVGRYSGSPDCDREQYFMFDFNRRETDPFAHIGFTIQKGSGIVEAQSCDNKPMMSDLDNGREKLNIHTALAAAGAKMSTFIHLNKNAEFKWSIESLLEMVKKNPGLFAIAFEKDNRYVLNCLTFDGVKKLAGHTMVRIGNYPVDNNNKIYVMLDMNLPVNDDKAVIVMRYVKDQYGDVTLKDSRDLFNADLKNGKYLSEIGISPNDFLNREAIDPSVMLHKLIDEHDEIGAIKLIEENMDTIDVNYEFNMRMPVFSALNASMFKLFSKMVTHPKFNSKVEDGFGETLLQSLLYMYSAEEISSSSEDEKSLCDMIQTITDNETFDFNARDLNGDTALTIVCEYPKMAWVAKKLIANRSVDVNQDNEFGFSPLSVCISHNNLDVLKELGKRPDLKITDKDKEAAKKSGINLDEYIKPDNTLLDDVNSMASLISELEAATVAAE
jgi:hypothetical protein